MYLVNSFSSLVASDVCFAPPDFECDFWAGLISWALLPRQLRRLIYAGVSRQEYVQHTDWEPWTLCENGPEGSEAEFLDRKNREWGDHVTSSFSGSFKIGHRAVVTSIQIMFGICSFFFFLEMKKDLFLFCFLVSALAAYVSKRSKHSATTTSCPKVKEPNGIKHQPKRRFQEHRSKSKFVLGNWDKELLERQSSDIKCIDKSTGTL